MSAKNTPKTRQQCKDFFLEKDVVQITALLAQVNQVSTVTGTLMDDGYHIYGLTDEQDIIISHPRTAKAFLDAYLMGYSDGWKDSEAAGQKAS